jgi:SP family general alpha glucoside:H+ symporter-like MFS transporter
MALINSLSDRIGRKWVLAWLTVLLAVVSGVFLHKTEFYRMYGLHRRATGSNWQRRIGKCVQTQCVIYIAECAPIAIRGTLLASYAFAYQIGGLTGAIGLQVLQTVSCPHYLVYDADQ